MFLSTVNFTTFDPADRDRLELGVLLGWEGTVADALTLDLGYGHYLYNSSGRCCGLSYLGASGFVTDQLELAARVENDPRVEAFNTRATMTVYPTDSLGLRATIGRS